MYTIFLTFLGFSFKKEVLGAFNFFGTMFGFTSQLLGAFYTIVERRIYIGKERLKSNIDYLLNLAFGNSVTFGIIMISLIILILNLIPIYFTELTDYINLIPFILLIFTIRNSIMISEYYINSYNLFFKRNIIAVILSSIYLLILNITNFKSIESFIITHVGVLIFYKIVIILFLKEFFTNKISVVKILFGDLVMSIIVSIFAFVVIFLQLNIFESIFFALLCFCNYKYCSFK